MVLARFLRGLGELLVTAGVVVLLFVAYELWFTDVRNAQTQQTLRHDLEQTWSRTPARGVGVSVDQVPLGDGLAVLRIPRFGRHYDPVVVEGVSTDDLKRGPGHYPGSALPGQVGNFVVSGHRTTYGKPFNRLGEIKVGDAVVVETRTTWFTYKVVATQVVLPTDVAVILPVPDQPGATPRQRLLTFTTCHPEYSASHRLVVHALLTGSQPKSAGPPSVLAAA